MTALILPKLGNCKDYREAERMLESMGARECGSGHFSRVYRIEVMTDPEFKAPRYMSYSDLANLNPWEMLQSRMVRSPERTARIIKVTKQRDKGALIVARTAMACAEVDPMAPVYYGITEFSDGCFMAEMEPLDELRDMDHHCGLTGTEKGAPAYLQNRRPLPEAIKASPFLSLLNCYMDKGYVWDLHSKNVMMRGGQPVITDPMFFSTDC
jgi:hypothetical protein